MTQFENEFSNFPLQKITLHEFENVNDTVAVLINQIEKLRSDGNYEAAQQLIAQNSSTLQKYIVDATTFRTWEEEIYNTQVYAMQAKQAIHFGSVVPLDCNVNDVWITG